MPRASGTIRIETNGNDGNITVLDYDGSGNVIYQGKARPGSLKSQAKWQIKKFTYSGSNLTDVQFAGGKDAFAYVWNDRNSLSYS